MNGNNPVNAFGNRRGIKDFLINEARLLDERRFEEWRDLFAEDGHYWVPLKPDQASPDGEASLFYDDKSIMDTRLERLRHPNIHAQSPPHRTCHLVSNVVLERVDPVLRECTIVSSMMMTDYRMRTQRLFCGRVEHRLRHDETGYKIVMKRVDLINCDDVFELIAIPI